MIEAVAGVCRWMAAISGSVIIGTTLFRYFCLRDLGPHTARTDVRSELLFWLLPSGLLLLLHIGTLAGQFNALGERALTLDGWTQFILDTHVGRVWMWRAAVALLVVPAAVLTRYESTRPMAIALLPALVALYICLGPWGGHAAGAENLAEALLLNVSHQIAVALWVGGLPIWAITVHRFSYRHLGLSQSRLADALTRFSHLATGLMAVIVVSGLLLADNYIDTEGDLLGTRYGALLLVKLALLGSVLLLANRLRQRFLPALHSGEDALQIAPQALRHVGIEMGLAAAMLGCATLLGQTTPALHDTAFWWMPVRWSWDATWVDKALRVWILGAVGSLTVASLLVGLGRSSRLRILGGVIGLASVGTLCWALAVPAYPDSFRRSDVPYLTVSIAEGRALYEAHCTGCHGSGGLGDGPFAKSLPRLPANLSEPHTALHTAGDMHWWLTHGIPAGGMPGFEKVMTVTDRWDVINFLRTFSQGFEARLLRPQVTPKQPWLGAPNFYIEQPAGPMELKGYRGLHNVLLVFLEGPTAKGRLMQLAEAQGQLAGLRTTILAVVDTALPIPAGLPFTVIQGGGTPIWSSYELLSRTVANRGMPDRLGMEWQHVEFLIDRFGYLRARWIAEADSDGWDQLEKLYPQLATLNLEPQLKPPPDDHVH
ncbi:MAG: CopD family protein [Stagnimonas sp.]|nr:CopD family protein [Stagnimonas sp.]